MVVGATLAGIALAAFLLLLQSDLSASLASSTASFTISYESGPMFADANDVIDYTIVVANSGALAQNVVLSDTVPSGAVFIPGSCTYTTQAGTLPCGPLSEMWREGFDTGDCITTTFSVRVIAGTLQWPLVNCAHLSWDGNQQTMCFTTMVNPSRAYLPLALCNYFCLPPFTCAPQLLAEVNTGPEPRGVAVDAAGQRAFVAHATGVSVIDTNSLEVIVEVQSLASAHGIAYDADHDRIWVTRIDADRVVVLDGTTYETLADLPTGDRPRSVAYNPTNDRVYVTNFGSGSVSVYDAGSLAYALTLRDFDEPTHVAVNHVTNKIYVTNHATNSPMTVIHGDTHTTERVAVALLDAFGITVDTTRNLVYATSSVEGRLAIVDGAADQLLGTRVIQHSSGQKATLRAIAVNPNVGSEGHLFLVASSEYGGEDQLLLIPNGWPTLGTPVALDIARYPKEGIALNPDTDRLWVTSVESGLVSVVQDGEPVCSTPSTFCAPQLVTRVNTGPEPRGVAVDAAGQRTFVAHATGVSVIDTNSFAAITEVSLASAHGIAYDAGRDRIWVTRIDADRVVVLDGTTHETLADLPTGDRPRSVAYNPTNDRVYVTNFGSGSVSVYDAGSLSYALTLRDFDEPTHIAVNHVTNKIYVTNHANNSPLTVIHGDTHTTELVAVALLDAFGITVDTTRNLVYATSSVEGRLAIVDGATDQLLGTQVIQHSSGQKATLRAIAVNPDVGSEGHLFLVASSEYGGEDQLLLIPNGWPTLGTPVGLDVARYSKEGIALDPDTDRLWVTSVESGLVSVVQDGEPVCSTLSPFDGEGVHIEVFTTH